MDSVKCVFICVFLCVYACACMCAHVCVCVRMCISIIEEEVMNLEENGEEMLDKL